MDRPHFKTARLDPSFPNFPANFINSRHQWGPGRGHKRSRSNEGPKKKPQFATRVQEVLNASESSWNILEDDKKRLFSILLCFASASAPPLHGMEFE